jgi:hypothetical protein
VLQGVALLRDGTAVDWSSVAAWAYVALFTLVGIAGAWGWTLVAGRARGPTDVGYATPRPVISARSVSPKMKNEAAAKIL